VVTLNVPKDRKAQWLDRVQVWLGMIASEAGPPVPDVGLTDIRAYARRRPA
jgi:hypothetical protein